MGILLFQVGAGEGGFIPLGSASRSPVQLRIVRAGVARAADACGATLFYTRPA